MYYYNRPGINNVFSDTSREKVSNYAQRYDQLKFRRQTDQMYNEMPNQTQNNQYNNMQVDMNEALMIIQDAIKGESEDAAFYEALISMAPSMEDKRIITEIRNAEMKHNRMFKQMYYELTGKTVAEDNNVATVQLASYCDGLKKALMGEQMAVAKYRKILFAMQDRKYINMMTEIITDELRHFGLYNYLYAKNNCNV
ncbi:MAG: ferritin-like domain-containing protein [Eubacteriales bacterium]